jgi:hypothetical protein
MKLENWIIGVGCLLYVLFVYLVHPEYFSFLLPIAFTVYGGIGGTVDQVLSALPLVVIAWLLLALLLGFLDKTPQAGVPLIAVVALGGAASYYLQFTGFEYHTYPFFVFTFIFLSFVLFAPGKRMVVYCFAIAGLLATFYFGPRPVRYSNIANEDILLQMDHVPKASRVLILSTNVYAGFPLVLAREWVWASRFPHQWMLPGALANAAKLDCADDPVKCRKNNIILDYSRRANIEDIKKYNPEFIILDNRKKKSYIDDPSFDYISFMSQDTAFAALWEDYKQTAETKYFTIWAK